MIVIRKNSCNLGNKKKVRHKTGNQMLCEYKKLADIQLGGDKALENNSVEMMNDALRSNAVEMMYLEATQRR